VLAGSSERDPSAGTVASVHVGKLDETTGERHTPRSVHASAKGETPRVVFHLSGPSTLRTPNENLKGSSS